MILLQTFECFTSEVNRRDLRLKAAASILFGFILISDTVMHFTVQTETSPKSMENGVFVGLIMYLILRDILLRGFDCFTPERK